MVTTSGGTSPGPRVEAGRSERAVDRVVRDNVRHIASMEEAEREKRTPVDRAIDVVSAFCGSVFFVYIHLIWFALWIGYNVLPLGGPRFDPWPFGLLTVVVSLEAILLSTFILILQNRSQRMADRRHQLDLQINMLAEQETTKILEILQGIQDHLGIEGHDPEVGVLKQATEPDRVVAAIEEYSEDSRQ
jgi:uncharacterized membrane protein